MLPFYTRVNATDRWLWVRGKGVPPQHVLVQDRELKDDLRIRVNKDFRSTSGFKTKELQPN